MIEPQAQRGAGAGKRLTHGLDQLRIEGLAIEKRNEGFVSGMPCSALQEHNHGSRPSIRSKRMVEPVSLSGARWTGPALPDGCAKSRRLFRSR